MVYPRRLTIIPVLLILVPMLAPTTLIGTAQAIEIAFEPKRDVYPVGFTVTVKFNGLTPGTIYKIKVRYQGDANIRDALEIAEIEGMKLIERSPSISSFLYLVNATATTASMKIKPLAAGTFQLIVKDKDDTELARSDKMVVLKELTVMEIQVFDAVTGQNITNKAIISLNSTVVQPPITVEIGKVYEVKVEAVGYETRTSLIKVEGPYIRWSIYLQPVDVKAVNLGNLTITIQYSDGVLAKDVDLEVQVYSAKTGRLVYAYYTTTGSISIDYVVADKYTIYVFDPSMKYVGKSEVEVKADETVEATVTLEVNEIYRELEAMSKELETLKSKAETATSMSGIATGLGIVGAIGALLSFYKTSMEVAELKQDISTIQNDIEDLKSSIEKLKEAMETILMVTDKVEENSQTISKLKEVVSTLSATVDKLETSLESLSTKLESTENRVSNLAETLANLGSALRDLAVKVGELSKRTSELEKENADLREKTVKVENVVEALNRTILGIKSKLRELADLSEDISRVKTSLQQLRDEVENIKRVVVDLTTWSSEANKALSELITRVGDNEEKVANIERRVNNIEGKMTSIEQRVSELETTVEKLQKIVKTVDELKTKLDNLSAHVGSLSEDIRGISGDISSLKSATVQTRKSVEGVAGQLIIAYGISIIGLLVAVAALFLIWRKITK